MVMSYARKGNVMYNIQNRQSQGHRIAIGSTGRSRAAELIRQGRARQLGIGYGPVMTCPGSTNTNCQPQVQTCPENQKRYIMPFIPDTGYTASVTAGSQVRFVGKPQKMFKPDRLIIASSIAPYFDVVNLLIANIPQSLSQGNVAADIYSEVSTYTLMSFDQAYPGIDIIIIAQNKSSVTQTFQAQLIGEAIG